MKYAFNSDGLNHRLFQQLAMFSRPFQAKNAISALSHNCRVNGIPYHFQKYSRTTP